MSDRNRCELCGIESHDVAWARLVEWTDDVVKRSGVPRFEAIGRCPDYQACRARVEARGQDWPVRDVVTERTVPLPPSREEVPV